MSDDIVSRLRVWSSWLDERIPDTEIGNDLRDAAAEIERLRAGGCARGQTTTQFCAEAERLRNELAACCGSGGAGPHTTGPTETFIPEAL